MANHVVTPTIKKRSFYGGTTTGNISGLIPGILTVDGSPAIREIEIRNRSDSRQIVETTWSNADGTYVFPDLTVYKEFDIIARDYERVYSDVMIPAVRPWPTNLTMVNEVTPTSIPYGGSVEFMFAGGSTPYTLTVNTAHPDVTYTLDERKLTVANAIDATSGTTTFTITEANGGTYTATLQVLSDDMTSTNWRVVIQDSSGGYACATEIEMAEFIGGPNKCIGGTATGFPAPFNGTSLPAGAFDGLTQNETEETMWIANAATGWIEYQFTSPVFIREVRYIPRKYYSQFPTSLVVESKQGGEWVAVRSFYLTNGANDWWQGTFRSFALFPDDRIIPTAITQSSVFNATYTQGTVANLTDQVLNGYGAATNNEVNAWIKADLGSAKLVKVVYVGGGYLDSLGYASSYQTGAKLQYSNDNSTWTTVPGAGSIVGRDYTDIKNTYPTGGITARWWRLQMDNNFLMATEFSFA